MYIKLLYFQYTWESCIKNIISNIDSRRSITTKYQNGFHPTTTQHYLLQFFYAQALTRWAPGEEAHKCILVLMTIRMVMWYVLNMNTKHGPCIMVVI